MIFGVICFHVFYVFNEPNGEMYMKYIKPTPNKKHVPDPPTLRSCRTIHRHPLMKSRTVRKWKVVKLTLKALIYKVFFNYTRVVKLTTPCGSKKTFNYTTLFLSGGCAQGLVRQAEPRSGQARSGPEWFGKVPSGRFQDKASNHLKARWGMPSRGVARSG